MVLCLGYLQKYLHILLDMEGEKRRNLSCVEVKGQMNERIFKRNKNRII